MPLQVALSIGRDKKNVTTRLRAKTGSTTAELILTTDKNGKTTCT
jgi:hypothetical protein